MGRAERARLGKKVEQAAQGDGLRGGVIVQRGMAQFVRQRKAAQRLREVAAGPSLAQGGGLSR